MKNKEKSIVLFSGGLDSTVNFMKAYLETEVVMILTFDYGQQSATWEAEVAKEIADKFSIRYSIIQLNWLKRLETGLANGKIPDFDDTRIDDLDYTKNTARAVWVPNRNGVMINIAASFADKNGIDKIVTGFNKEEGATFPDNSAEFIARVNRALEYSTLYPTQVVCYTIDMNKSEIVKLGIDIGAPFEYIWSCYYGDSKMCGKCESCQRLKRALKSAGYFDEFIKINRWGFK
jgi:7-cyano-7-deazaguanine synthase